MRKTIAALSCLALVLVLSGCPGQEPGGSKPPPAPVPILTDASWQGIWLERETSTLQATARGFFFGELGAVNLKDPYFSDPNASIPFYDWVSYQEGVLKATTAATIGSTYYLFEQLSPQILRQETWGRPANENVFYLQRTGYLIRSRSATGALSGDLDAIAAAAPSRALDLAGFHGIQVLVHDLKDGMAEGAIAPLDPVTGTFTLSEVVAEAPVDIAVTGIPNGQTGVVTILESRIVPQVEDEDAGIFGIPPAGETHSAKVNLVPLSYDDGDYLVEDSGKYLFDAGLWEARPTFVLRFDIADYASLQQDAAITISVAAPEGASFLGFGNHKGIGTGWTFTDGSDVVGFKSASKLLSNARRLDLSFDPPDFTGPELVKEISLDFAITLPGHGQAFLDRATLRFWKSKLQVTGGGVFVDPFGSARNLGLNPHTNLPNDLVPDGFEPGSVRLIHFGGEEGVNGMSIGLGYTSGVGANHSLVPAPTSSYDSPTSLTKGDNYSFSLAPGQWAYFTW